MCNERYVTVRWKPGISLCGDLDTYNNSTKLVLLAELGRNTNTARVCAQASAYIRDAAKYARIIKRPVQINNREIASDGVHAAIRLRRNARCDHASCAELQKTRLGRSVSVHTQRVNSGNSHVTHATSNQNASTHTVPIPLGNEAIRHVRLKWNEIPEGGSVHREPRTEDEP